jgi:hypothetical protein
MFKCAPYIKNICSSINTTWWRDDGTSSLPPSPIRQSWNNQQRQNGEGGNQLLPPPPCPSPSRSETAVTLRGGLEEEEDERLLWSAEHHHALSMPSLVATTTVDKDGIASSEVTMCLIAPPAVRHQPLPAADLLSGLKRAQRPTSPDVTRSAMKLEREKQLGAIPKIALYSSASTTGAAATLDSPSPTSTSRFVIALHSRQYIFVCLNRKSTALRTKNYSSKVMGIYTVIWLSEMTVPHVRTKHPRYKWS